MSQRDHLTTAFNALLGIVSDTVAEQVLAEGIKALSATLGSTAVASTVASGGKRERQVSPYNGQTGKPVDASLIEKARRLVEETSWSRAGREIGVHENTLRRIFETQAAAPETIEKLRAWAAPAAPAPTAPTLDEARVAESLWSAATARAGDYAAAELVAEVFNIPADAALEAHINNALPAGVDPIVAAAWTGGFQ